MAWRNRKKNVNSMKKSGSSTYLQERKCRRVFYVIALLLLYTRLYRVHSILTGWTTRTILYQFVMHATKKRRKLHGYCEVGYNFYPILDENIWKIGIQVLEMKTFERVHFNTEYPITSEKLEYYLLVSAYLDWKFNGCWVAI